MNNHYNKHLKMYARELRSLTVSRAERRIWKALLSRKQMGVAFKRQRPIGFYIVDFFAAEIKLIIEIDGNSHLPKGTYDQRRQNYIESLGYTVIRFSEGEVLNCLDDVHAQISRAIFVLQDIGD